MPTIFNATNNTIGPPEPLVGDLACYEDPELSYPIPEVTDLDLGTFPYNKLGNVLSTGFKLIWVKNESNKDSLLFIETNNPDVDLASITKAMSATRINKGEVVEVTLRTKLIPPATGRPIAYTIVVKGNFFGAER